ncbi:hypothetical protein BC826DRAFT_1109169 [Russula brevipes]|nr:hypothetical protein BC826DRAFT_1109169 [Russula brevipes]
MGTWSRLLVLQPPVLGIQQSVLTMSAMSSDIRIRKSDQSPIPIPIPTNIIAQGVLPYATPTDNPSEGLQMGERSTHLQGEFHGPQGLCQASEATIDKLTDDALLEIFDSCLSENHSRPRLRNTDEWHALVHVCRRWRNIVFASPHRLNLRLLCTRNRSVKATLNIWPVLPLEVDYSYMGTWEVQDNVIAALEHHDRVRQIFLGAVPNPVWETLAAAMQVPFPELISLWLLSDRSMPVLFPDVFLGGSAPRLKTVCLEGIPFPAVRNLLLSASDLVNLSLWRLPHSGYISPALMVACLSSLNRLESLELGFQSPLSRPNQPSPPPQTRVVLPALSYLNFIGMTDYSEEFVARIDTPVFNQLYMVFFMDLVFDIPHLKQFIGRARGLKPSKAARLLFEPQSIRLELGQLDQPPGPRLEVRCNRMDWQLDSMALICGQLSSFFTSIERLDLIWGDISLEPQGKDDMESTQFLEIFQPFTAIRSLYVYKTLVPFIASALVLKELDRESATEVLPDLCDLFLGGSAISGSIQEDIQPFIEARRLSSQPVAVHHWAGWPRGQ